MKENILNDPRFRDDEKAREYLEKIRWNGKPVCPHCGNTEKIYRLTGKSTRPGLLKCGNGNCRKQFSVTVGTVFERSHIPLHKWLTATYLVCCSKKGMSALQIQRMLGLTYKSTWFMIHRIREAMKDSFFVKQLGGKDKIVEADETFWGNTRKLRPGARGYAHKEKVFALVERGGDVRSFHVPSVNGATLKPILKEQIKRDTHIMTDDMGAYYQLEKHFDNHSVICHSKKEYVRGAIHTNTIEGYFSLLKRGLIGTYHHVGPQHLKRYVSEFDFRYNHRKINDVERSDIALRGIEGKRLLYRDSQPGV
jgi:transposase-like protein